MDNPQDIERTNDQEHPLNLQNLENFPPNIQYYPGSNGTLCVAVDQNGRAIALAFVPRQ